MERYVRVSLKLGCAGSSPVLRSPVAHCLQLPGARAPRNTPVGESQELFDRLAGGSHPGCTKAGKTQRGSYSRPCRGFVDRWKVGSGLNAHVEPVRRPPRPRMADGNRRGTRLDVMTSSECPSARTTIKNPFDASPARVLAVRVMSPNPLRRTRHEFVAGGGRPHCAYSIVCEYATIQSGSCT